MYERAYVFLYESVKIRTCKNVKVQKKKYIKV